MKPFQTILAWSWLAILPMTPSSAYDGMSSDPGSYRQGSSARDYGPSSGSGPDYGGGTYGGSGSGAQNSGRTDYGSFDYGSSGYGSSDYGGANYGERQRSDWYSSDWYSEQVGDRWRGGEGSWAAPESSARQGLESADSDPGYGWREYALPGDHTPANQAPRYARPQYDAPRYRDDRYDNAQRGQWAAPVARPRYRFRDDASLNNQGLVGGASGYRFRPLTDKESERHRDAADVTPFPRSRRDQGRDSGSRSGDAFGYEPDVTPGSFYDRYYRSDP
jgi:hypothetical protein